MNKEEQKQKREEWRIRIGEWEESGLTQIEFCRRNNLDDTVKSQNSLTD